MDILLSTITLVLAVGLVLYHRTSLAVSLLMIGAALIGTTVLGWTEGTSWIVFIVLSAIVAIPAVRQSLFSAKALQFFKKVLPAMSQTEKEALDAGTVWWEAELFKGKPDWRQLQSIKKPTLTKEEQEF